MKENKLYKMSTAALLFFAVLVATLFLQVSNLNSQARARATWLNDSDPFRPDAGLELESLDQVQEINEHNFKFYEINRSEELPE